MSLVAQILAWLLLVALFTAIWSRIVGPRTPEQQALEDQEQADALARGPGYEEHA